MAARPAAGERAVGASYHRRHVLEPVAARQLPMFGWLKRLLGLEPPSRLAPARGGRAASAVAAPPAADAAVPNFGLRRALITTLGGEENGDAVSAYTIRADLELGEKKPALALVSYSLVFEPARPAAKQGRSGRFNACAERGDPVAACLLMCPYACSSASSNPGPPARLAGPDSA